jgi:hypothetical protein
MTENVGFFNVSSTKKTAPMSTKRAEQYSAIPLTQRLLCLTHSHVFRTTEWNTHRHQILIQIQQSFLYLNITLMDSSSSLRDTRISYKGVFSHHKLNR